MKTWLEKRPERVVARSILLSKRLAAAESRHAREKPVATENAMGKGALQSGRQGNAYRVLGVVHVDVALAVLLDGRLLRETDASVLNGSEHLQILRSAGCQGREEGTH